jgi:NTE family protein
MQKSNIKSLAISGGGTRIVAEVGAIEVLEQQGIISQLERIGGTSAGSILSALIAVGYTCSELKQMVFELDFKKFEDGKLLEKVDVLRDYGVNKGNTFLKFLEEKIESKTGSKYTTFAGLKAKKMLDLTVFAVDLNTESLKVFNFENTPNVSIAHAVRCSMSIPLFFEPFYLPNDNHVYVDGGAMVNYPLNYYPKEETIGIAFKPVEKVEDNGLKKGQFKRYITSLLSSLANSQSINFAHDKEAMSRSIIIDSLGFSAVNFDLTKEEKTTLYNEGVRAANSFF